MKLLKLFEYYEQILLEGKYDAMWPDDFDEFSDIITDLLANEDVKVKVHDPQYGFNGFDDDFFKTDLDALIKRLK